MRWVYGTQTAGTERSGTLEQARGSSIQPMKEWRASYAATEEVVPATSHYPHISPTSVQANLLVMKIGQSLLEARKNAVSFK